MTKIPSTVYICTSKISCKPCPEKILLIHTYIYTYIASSYNSWVFVDHGDQLPKEKRRSRFKIHVTYAKRIHVTYTNCVCNWNWFQNDFKSLALTWPNNFKQFDFKNTSRAPVTQYSQRIEMNYSKWGASATDITSVLGSDVLYLA
jgi:hypothetical protein